MIHRKESSFAFVDALFPSRVEEAGTGFHDFLGKERASSIIGAVGRRSTSFFDLRIEKDLTTTTTRVDAREGSRLTDLV